MELGMRGFWEAMTQGFDKFPSRLLVEVGGAIVSSG